MKTYCPNCEKETECEHTAELYECKECGEDFAKYIVSRKPQGGDVSVTEDVLTDIKTSNSAESDDLGSIKTRALNAIEIATPIDKTINWYIDEHGEIDAVHQTDLISIEERLAVIAHALAHDVINLLYYLETANKRGDGLSEIVEMYKTMLRSKDVIICNQESRINELAERLLKGGENAG